ncbi:hypothetical protein J2X32_002122 [Rheinheimera pacifica]|nr:hypothetical protein [Rheinheimera pacifica]
MMFIVHCPRFSYEFEGNLSRTSLCEPFKPEQ